MFGLEIVRLGLRSRRDWLERRRAMYPAGVPADTLCCQDGHVTGVYLEIGKRRAFACAWDWPGWCRAGRSEDAALSALQAAAPRFAVVCGEGGVAFDPAAAVISLEVLERVAGTAATDFGALDVPPQLDAVLVTSGDAHRLAAIVEAAWAIFDQTAAAAPATLPKGPRGGGRDREAIVEHVLATEVLHARMLGLRQRPFPAGDQRAAARVRALVLTAIHGSGAGRQGNQHGRGQRPLRFVARRVAWHALDHAWEIQDRAAT